MKRSRKIVSNGKHLVYRLQRIIVLAIACLFLGSSLPMGVRAANLESAENEALAAGEGPEIDICPDSEQADIEIEDPEPETVPELFAQSAVVMDVESGNVLWEKNPHERHYPASITKILTALLAVENSSMEEEVAFSYDSVHNYEPSSGKGACIWREEGEILTMEQVLHALMLKSANDCAYAIAEHVGGNYDGFIDMMNKRALELGCINTRFKNPHGLPDEEHVTSSYDMALIARDAIQNDQFRTLIATERYEIPPTNLQEEMVYLRNGHKMLMSDTSRYEESVIGGKTGFTNAAWNTLVTYAERNGVTLVCVVLKSGNPSQYMDTKALLDHVYEHYDELNARPEATPAVEADALDVAEMAEEAPEVDLVASKSDSVIQDGSQSSTSGPNRIFWGAMGVVALAGAGYAMLVKFVRK